MRRRGWTPSWAPNRIGFMPRLVNLPPPPGLKAGRSRRVGLGSEVEGDVADMDGEAGTVEDEEVGGGGGGGGGGGVSRVDVSRAYT